MLQTRSSFYFDIKIDPGQNRISFQELTGPLRIAVLQAKSYTLESLSIALAQAFTLAGNQVYTATFDRVTKSITLSAPDDFDILVQSGPFNGSSVYSRLALGTNDLTGQNSYTTGVIGKEYRPQLFLLDYVPGNLNQQAIESSINETSGGEVEVVRYGIKKIFEMTIDFVTETYQENGWIENDNQALAKLQEFIEFLVQKNVVEFYPDRDNLDESVILLLERTGQSQQGVGFKIQEKPSFVGYYTTGLLQFREVL